MNKNKKTIVAFGAHPDDVEFGCGGALLLLKEHQYNIIIVDLTRGEAATFGSRQRLTEARIASKILGIRREILNLGDKQIKISKNCKVEIKKILRKYKPSFAFAPYFIDKHKDHVNTAKLISQFVPTVHYFISAVEKENVGVDITEYYTKKFKAISAYKTQIRPGDIKWIRERHKNYGAKINVKWGELFFYKGNIELPPMFKKITTVTI